MRSYKTITWRKPLYANLHFSDKLIAMTSGGSTAPINALNPTPPKHINCEQIPLFCIPRPPMPPCRCSPSLHHTHDGSHGESTPEPPKPVTIPSKPSRRQKYSKQRSSPSQSESPSPRPQLGRKGLGQQNILNNTVQVTVRQAKVKFQSLTLSGGPSQWTIARISPNPQRSETMTWNPLVLLAALRKSDVSSKTTWIGLSARSMVSRML